jgi:hypothetical protein
MATSSLAWTHAAALLGLPRATGWPATLDTLQAAALQSSDRTEAGIIAATLADACQAGTLAHEAGERVVRPRRRGYIGQAPADARLRPTPAPRTVQAYSIGPHALADWLRAQGLTPGPLVAAWAASQAKPATPATLARDRQDRRLQACEAAGLQMPASPLGRLPAGVGRLAEAEGATRQAYSNDLKAALERRAAAARAGTVTHRTK